MIDGYLNDLWLYAPEISYSGSRVCLQNELDHSVTVMLIVDNLLCLQDTLQELCVEIWFKGLKRGAVVDNE